MKNKRAFGLRIRYAREYQKITLEKIAELCECSESIWKQYERGERLPSLSNFIKIINKLKVTPEYLLGDELAEMQENLANIEQLKLKIDQLHPDDIAVIEAAVTKRLELRNNNL